MPAVAYQFWAIYNYIPYTQYYTYISVEYSLQSLHFHPLVIIPAETSEVEFTPKGQCIITFAGQLCVFENFISYHNYYKLKENIFTKDTVRDYEIILLFFKNTANLSFYTPIPFKLILQVNEIVNSTFWHCNKNIICTCM